ncbi:hypothetical protein Patl1_22240 [Pistacia atlantica]|uniref:Uncharacterized protein n=1 Tax=Pistacia atlantica TaxID=434234 RepID=A0ACC1BJ73_9ROSI|nr:hypothetical protein Patl1_22240 [Pistacia atlantica]
MGTVGLAPGLSRKLKKASHGAQQALDRVEEEVNELAQCCDRIEKALNSCNATTGNIIETTERLKRDLEVNTQRQEIVSCFLRDYQLSDEEINALRDEDLNENFFKALSHVQEIHANCKVLLRTHHQNYHSLEESSQRAGLELMDMMAVYQEGAYERLCRWVQAECRKLGDTENPEVGELLKTAVCCLKERPVLFKYCAEEVANMRHNALFRRFISALTRGGPGGLPRPIEVHAHDPLRYVGDMLGWLHQALASERELVLGLLDPDATVDIGVTASRFSKNLENDSGKTDCRPDISVDLSPPPAVREGVSILLEIIETHNSMMVPTSAKKSDFDLVISALLDPIIQMCEQAAEAHKSKGAGHSSRRSRMSSDLGQISKSSVDAILSNSSSTLSTQNNETPSKIFLINCLCAIQQPLLGHEVAAEYVKNLGSMIENHMGVLVDKEVDAILRRCGLSQKMHHFHGSLNKEFSSTVAGPPLAEIEDTSPASLSECLKAFFGLILGSESSLPEFELMQVPKLRSEACIKVARSLAEAYELIYRAIMAPENGYPDPKSLARHPPPQIRTILGI